MAVNRPRPWLVCYDIADPDRLARVHRRLKDAGLPVQYSVFAVSLNARKSAELLAELRDLIDEREDDVRFYPMLENAPRIEFGRQLLPDELLMIGLDGELSGRASESLRPIGVEDRR